MQIPLKLNIELPYDPAIPVLGTYLEKTLIWKDSCTPMFIAALFKIAKTWKQPQCPSTDKWIKMWHTHIQRGREREREEYYSAIKKEWNNTCSNMNGLRGYVLSEASKRKTNTIWYHLHVESKIWHKWTYLQKSHRHREQTMVTKKGRGWRRG